MPKPPHFRRRITCTLFVLLLSTFVISACSNSSKTLKKIKSSTLKSYKPWMGSGTRFASQIAVISPSWRRPVNPAHKHHPITWKLVNEETAKPLLTPHSKGAILYVGSTQQLVSAYRARNGKLVWTKKLKGRVVSSPNYHNNILYVGTTSGMFYALNRSNGKKLWTYQASGEILSQPTIITSTQNSLEPSELRKKAKPAYVVFTTNNNQVLSLNAVTGKFNWLYNQDPPNQLTIRGQAPALHSEGKIYTGFSNGSVVSLKASDGTLLWKRSIQESQRFSDVDEPLVLWQGFLYAASFHGSLHALDAKTGKTRWKHKLRGASKVFIQDDELFVTSSEGHIRSLEASSGTVNWKKRFKKSGSLSAPTGNVNHLFINASRMGIFVLERSSGKQIQLLRFGSGFSSTPLLHHTNLYTVSNGGFVYSFSTILRTLHRR